VSTIFIKREIIDLQEVAQQEGEHSQQEPEDQLGEEHSFLLVGLVVSFSPRRVGVVRTLDGSHGNACWLEEKKGKKKVGGKRLW
jgi:hypothetical protein